MILTKGSTFVYNKNKLRDYSECENTFKLQMHTCVLNVPISRHYLYFVCVVSSRQRFSFIFDENMFISKSSFMQNVKRLNSDDGVCWWQLRLSQKNKRVYGYIGKSLKIWPHNVTQTTTSNTLLYIRICYYKYSVWKQRYFRQARDCHVCPVLIDSHISIMHKMQSFMMFYGGPYLFVKSYL